MPEACAPWLWAAPMLLPSEYISALHPLPSTQGTLALPQGNGGSHQVVPAGSGFGLCVY